MMKQFQFHKGTIKTAEAYHQSPEGFVFQFHKGTIKTILERKDVRGTILISIP